MLIAHILKEKGGEVHSLLSSVSLCEAARALTAQRVGALVVLDEAGTLVGVLSERDIVREIARRGPSALNDRVGAAMTKDVITAHPMETLDDALARMSDRRIRHLPITDRERLIGIVSIGDLVARKIEEAQNEAAAMHAYIAAG